MFKKISSKFIFLGLIFALFILLSPSYLKSQEASKGNIIGFVYGEDGKTPLEGAIVKLQNAVTGEIYESTKSDVSGIFEIKGVESGSYMFMILAAQGEFSSIDPIELKIKEKETIEIAISLIPYEERIASAIREIPEEKEIKGEILVGRVIKFFPETMTANIFIFKERVRYRDRIHLKTPEPEEEEEQPEEEEEQPEEEVTNFYQEAYDLKIAGVSVKKVPAGQVVTLILKNNVDVGDLLYVVRRKRLLPLFIIPIGIASIVVSPETPGESK